METKKLGSIILGTKTYFVTYDGNDEPQVFHIIEICGIQTKVLFFTKRGQTVKTHLLEKDHYPIFVRCTADDGYCPNCEKGKKIYHRFLLPVYAIDIGNLSILPIDISNHPKSLYTQLMKILKTQVSHP